MSVEKKCIVWLFKPGSNTSGETRLPATSVQLRWITTWPAHWMPYSLQKWPTYSFYWVVGSIHSSSAEQLAHQKWQDLVGREALWSCQNASLAPYWGSVYVYIRHPLGSLGILGCRADLLCVVILFKAEMEALQVRWLKASKDTWGDYIEGMV